MQEKQDTTYTYMDCPLPSNILQQHAQAISVTLAPLSTLIGCHSDASCLLRHPHPCSPSQWPDAARRAVLVNRLCSGVQSSTVWALLSSPAPAPARPLPPALKLLRVKGLHLDTQAHTGMHSICIVAIIASSGQQAPRGDSASLLHLPAGLLFDMLLSLPKHVICTHQDKYDVVQCLMLCMMAGICTDY